MSLYFFVLGILLLLPGQNVYEKALPPVEAIDLPSLPFALPTAAAYPVQTNIVTAPSVSATGVIILDLASGVTLFEKNPDLPLPPASTTKIMTAIVALDHFKPEEIVTVSQVTSDGRTMGLLVGEEISIESLLYGLLVHSANDAAIAIASSYPGGMESFVAAMDKKAKELHLAASTFTNPVGFDDTGELMSARDLARLSVVALSHKLIAKIIATRTITVSDIHYSRFHDLTNVNELLGRLPGIAGFKTGFTPNAGESLVALYVKPPAELVSVVLGSNDRFGETQKLISWVLANFTWQGP